MSPIYLCCRETGNIANVAPIARTMAFFQDLFIRIKSQDLTGGVFNKLRNSVGGAAAEAGNLTGAIRSGVLQANLMTGAFTSVVGAAQRGISSIQGAIAEATSLQLEGVTAAQTFASLTGSSYGEAAKVMEDLNNRLSKSAAALPGNNAEYRSLATTINDSLIPAFQDLNGNLDLEAFKDSTASISESFGALTAASTRDIGNTSLSLTKALSGASVAELRSLAFFENNPAILGEIESKLQEVGAASLRDLDIKSRVKLIESAGKKFITEDFRTQAGQSVEGLVQSFKSAITDPTTGIFGIMRDLDLDTEGTQSAFSSFNEVVKSLIGDRGLFGASGPIVAIAQTLGFNFDPMLALRDAFDMINGGLQRATQYANDVLGIIQGGGGSLEGMIAHFRRTFLLSFERGLAQLSAFIDRTDFRELGERVGEVTGPIVAGLIDVMRQLPWPEIFTVLGDALIGAIQFVGGVIGAAAAEVLPALGQTLKSLVVSYLDQWPVIFKASLDIIQIRGHEIMRGVRDQILGFLEAAAGAIAQATNPLNVAKSVVRYSTPGLGPRYMGQIPPVATAASGLFNALATEANAAPRNSGLVIANSSETILTPQQRDAFAAGAASAGGGGGQNVTVNFSPTINLGGGSTEQQAREILRYLDAMLVDRIQGQLA